MEGKSGRFSGSRLPDAVGISRHGADIGEIMSGDLAADISREPLQPGSLEKDARWFASRYQHQHLGHEDGGPGFTEMGVVENAASHHPPGGGIEEEEPLFRALIWIRHVGGGNLLYDILNFVHDIT